MTNRVYYHHQDDRQYSLDYVNPDLKEIGRRVVDYDGHKSIKVEEYDLDQTVYVVYTASGASGEADEIEYDLVDSIASMESANSVIATRFVDLFKNVLKTNYEEEGVSVQAYKNIEIESIEPALNQVDWDGSATEVAGRLTSNLILKHMLPNANHRTAIGMMQLYLRRIDPNFTMPKTAEAIADGEYDWMDWVNEYINESKRLSTVRRKGDRFKYLDEFGCDVLERKHGIEIQLDEYELDMYPSDRWEIYAERHEELWIEFAEAAVRRAKMDELTDISGLTKHGFANELRNLD